MLKIGLTGGIGSGKSTVCRLFSEWDVPIIDADVIARQLVEPEQPALMRLAEVFGKEILSDDGRLDRAKLRAKVFSDACARQQLDAIMHPLVYQEIESVVTCLQGTYCVIAIPLLLETNKQHVVDRVLVVDCSVEAQMQRILERDKIKREQAQAIIAAQVDRQQRLAAADDIIDNSTTLAYLAEQVKKLHNSYLLLATTRTISA